MMKKMMGLVLAIFLVVGTAGSATAAIGDFFLVAYDNTTNDLPIPTSGTEMAVNFGDPAVLDFLADFQDIDTGITLGDFGAGFSDWSDVYVGVFGGTFGPAYFGSGDVPVMGGPGGYSSFQSAAFNMGSAFYDGGPMTDTASYINQMDGGGFSPTYATLLQNIGEVQLVHNGIANIDIYVTPDGAGYSKLATWELKTTADGSLVVNAVPVPGAVILLGSACLGLVGLRRSKKLG